MNAPDIVTLSRDEYNALLDRLEDAEDELALKRFNEDVAARGWDIVTRNCLPVALVERKLEGEHPLRIWREHRNLTGNRLAELSGVPQSYISDIETAKKPGSIAALTKLARALEIQIDDLVPVDR